MSAACVPIHLSCHLSASFWALPRRKWARVSSSWHRGNRVIFFLQGARLSRDAILNGITHWRLHATIATTTFVLFPLVGVGLTRVFPSMLPPSPWTGVLFVCALPSKQDEIAAVFCGSQKSPVSSVPIASALLSGAAVGPILIPIMIYYPVQIVVCAGWPDAMPRRRTLSPAWLCEPAVRASVGERRPPKSCKLPAKAPELGFSSPTGKND
jgi:predicted Na+-dependent transporter